jgi:hypothetical protein
MHITIPRHFCFRTFEAGKHLCLVDRVTRPLEEVIRGEWNGNRQDANRKNEVDCVARFMLATVLQRVAEVTWWVGARKLHVNAMSRHDPPAACRTAS